MAGQQTYGWRDLRVPVVAQAPAAAAPTLTAFGPTGTVQQYAFALNDAVYLSAQVNHDYVPGSTAHVSVHWSTNGTNANTVKWQIDYTLASGHNQSNFPADGTVTVEEAAQGTAWRHMTTQDATGFSLIEVGTVICMKLTRITNGGTDNADTVFGLSVDFHYQVQQYATKNRAPNFYT